MNSLDFLHEPVREAIAGVIVFGGLGWRSYRARRIAKIGTTAQAKILYVEKGLTVRRDFFVVRLKLILEITRPDGTVFVANTSRWYSADTVLSDGWIVDVAYVERAKKSHRSPVAILGDPYPPRAQTP